MAIKYGKKSYKQNSIIYTVVAAILLCTVFLAMVSYFYSDAQNYAYENLHVQTKQIKDDISLQLISDRENLQTMANFAAKLYKDGESYDLMFESFKPIGLIENIGILNTDNTFVTKAGKVDLNGLISFDDESAKGAYISGRVKDLTRDGYEIIRSAVPINVNGNTVGMLYGVIKLDKVGERYGKMAEELDAQLFVYDKETGNLVIDTVHDKLGNISFLKERRFNMGYSYEQMVSTDKGFTSFMSAYREENMHLHYSTIENVGWMIALARYDSQVFAETHALSNILFVAFLAMLVIMTMYILILMANEKWVNSITVCASDIRKKLLETADNKNYIVKALKRVCIFSGSRSAMFFDGNGEEFGYISPEYKGDTISAKDRKYFVAELFRYAAEFHGVSGKAVNVLCIKPNKHLENTNPDLYKILNDYKIKDVSFSATIDNANYTTILCTINAKYAKSARLLAEKTAACFSMALYNKNTLKKTQHAATTDALTGVMNRVAYKRDVEEFNREKPLDFACVYIDVNGLHLCNNTYGHAAGDAMLLYIANTLKEVFYGHKVYRMGGDEFLVFCENMTQEDIKKKIVAVNRQLKQKNYYVAIGMSYRTQNTNAEEMVKEAEVRMYKEKAQYYQYKEQSNVAALGDEEYVQAAIGIPELDTMLSVLKENYNGIYKVSLDTDKAKRILMPAYLNYNENEDHFSMLYSKYVSEAVDSDYHRAVISFLNYDAIKAQLNEGKVPKVLYKKISGETVVLSVYKLRDGNDNSDTLWVFAKE